MGLHFLLGEGGAGGSGGGGRGGGGRGDAGRDGAGGGGKGGGGARGGPKKRQDLCVLIPYKCTYTRLHSYAAISGSRRIPLLLAEQKRLQQLLLALSYYYTGPGYSFW